MRHYHLPLADTLRSSRGNGELSSEERKASGMLGLDVVGMRKQKAGYLEVGIICG